MIEILHGNLITSVREAEMAAQAKVDAVEADIASDIAKDQRASQILRPTPEIEAKRVAKYADRRRGAAIIGAYRLSEAQNTLVDGEVLLVAAAMRSLQATRAEAAMRAELAELNKPPIVFASTYGAEIKPVGDGQPVYALAGANS